MLYVIGDAVFVTPLMIYYDKDVYTFFQHFYLDEIQNLGHVLPSPLSFI